MASSTGSPCVANSCYDWEDTRTYHSNGKVLSGHVRDKQTNEVFSAAKSNDHDLHAVFQRLALFQIPYMLGIRIPRRIIALFQGNFVLKGYELAEMEWLTENSQHSQTWSPHYKEAIRPVSYASLYTKTIIKLLWELAKEVAKIVTYPLAMISLEFCALYGAFINPLDGRKMWARMEYVWRVSDPEDNSCPVNFFTDSIHLLAPCLQTDHVWDESNLYRAKDMYHPGTIRSLIRALKHRLDNDRNFLEQEGIDVKRILQSLEVYQQQKVRFGSNEKRYFKTCVSNSDIDEIYFFGRGIRHNDCQRSHAQALQQLLGDLNSFRKRRIEIISLQRALHGNTGDAVKTQIELLTKAEEENTRILSKLESICNYWDNCLPVLMHRKMGCRVPAHDTLRFRIKEMCDQLQRHREVYKEEGLDVQRFIDHMTIYLTYKREDVRKSATFFNGVVTAHDRVEMNGKGILQHSDLQKHHADGLEKMRKDLDVVRMHRATILEIPKNFESADFDQHRLQHIAKAELRKKQALARLESICNYWQEHIPSGMHAQLGCKCSTLHDRVQPKPPLAASS